MQRHALVNQPRGRKFIDVGVGPHAASDAAKEGKSFLTSRTLVVQTTSLETDCTGGT